MIGRPTGILIEKRPPQVLLDVHGIGYEIDVPMSTYYDLPANGMEVTLYTHLSIREDMHLLFGFENQKKKRLACCHPKNNRIHFGGPGSRNRKTKAQLKGNPARQYG